MGTPDREPYAVNQEAVTAIGDFKRFLQKEKLSPARTMTSGGGRFEGFFWVDDWPKVEAWLSQNGLKQGTTSPGIDWGNYEKMGG